VIVVVVVVVVAAVVVVVVVEIAHATCTSAGSNSCAGGGGGGGPMVVPSGIEIDSIYICICLYIYIYIYIYPQSTHTFWMMGPTHNRHGWLVDNCGGSTITNTHSVIELNDGFLHSLQIYTHTNTVVCFFVVAKTE
jgi:hypothetical protein